MIPEAAIAMLACADRRDPLDRFRRFRPMLWPGASRLRVDTGDHRRWRQSRRQAVPLKDNVDKALSSARMSARCWWSITPRTR
jgi:hypothetical protein